MFSSRFSSSSAFCARRDRLRSAYCGLLVALVVSGCSDTGVPLLSGQRLQVQPGDGEWTVINYWATWCAPCREEIPELNRMNEDKQVRVIGVNFDQLAPEPLRQAVREMEIGFEVALEDPRAYWQYDAPQALPATVLISPSGEVKATLLGPQTEEALRQRMLR